MFVSHLEEDSTNENTRNKGQEKSLNKYRRNIRQRKNNTINKILKILREKVCLMKKKMPLQAFNRSADLIRQQLNSLNCLI